MDKSTAESEISRILQELEKDCDCVVESLSLSEIEITTLAQGRRHYKRQVYIVLSPIREW